MTRTTNKAARLTRLVQLMELRPRGVVELAREFGVSRRSIERDLHDLRDMGHSLEERDDHTYALASRGSALNEVEALATTVPRASSSTPASASDTTARHSRSSPRGCPSRHAAA